MTIGNMEPGEFLWAIIQVAFVVWFLSMLF